MSRSSSKSGRLLLLISTLALGASRPAAATPLGLAWGAVAEPATATAITPGGLAEQLEFLRTHGWQPIRAAEVGGTEGERTVLLGFDDPESALRYVVPLLELYEWPAVVSVNAAQAADPALRQVLAGLARSPWIELVPRVEPEFEDGGPSAVHCRVEGTTDPTQGEVLRLRRLRLSLAATVARLRESAAQPAAVVWAPSAWTGPAEAEAAALGLKVSLPTFTDMPPRLSAPRVARFALPAHSGISELVQASVGWDPRDHPVRFVEVDAAWVCADSDPAARVERLTEAVRELGANGVRLRPGGADGAWFETAAAPVRGDVIGPLARSLRAAGVRWLLVDLPAASGDSRRDALLAGDLARALEADVVILPRSASATADRELGEVVRRQRPATRLAWAGEGAGRAFFFEPPGAERQNAERGATVLATTAGAANAEATARAIAGWSWLGLPVELAETGLASSLRTLAAFVLTR
jgi:hypothetical protein